MFTVLAIISYMKSSAKSAPEPLDNIILWVDPAWFTRLCAYPGAELVDQGDRWDSDTDSDDSLSAESKRVTVLVNPGCNEELRVHQHLLLLFTEGSRGRRSLLTGLIKALRSRITE